MIATAVIISASGSDAERRFCTSAFITSPTDPDRPSQNFVGGIVGVDFSGAETAGVVFFDRQTSSRAGTVTLKNADRKLNSLVDLIGLNRTVEVRTGEPDKPWNTWKIDYIGLLDDVEPVNALCTLRINSLASRLEKVINTFYTTGPRAGQVQPIVIGKCFNIAPHQIGALQYRFSDVDCTLVRVRDQGDELTSTQYTDNNDGTFTLTVAPVGRITCDAIGPDSVENGNPSNYLTGFLESVFERAGLSAGAIGTAPLSTYEFGFFADKSVTALQILDEVSRSIGGSYFQDRTGFFRMVQLPNPQSLTSTVAIDHDESGFFPSDFAQKTDRMVGYSNTVAAGKNWYVNTQTEIAGSVAATALGQQLQSDYRFRALGVVAGPGAPIASDKVGATIGSKQSGIGTLIQDATSAQAEADRWALLYDVPRRFIRISLIPDATNHALEMMSGVTLTSTLLGLTNFKCVVTSIARTATKIDLELWG